LAGLCQSVFHIVHNRDQLLLCRFVLPGVGAQRDLGSEMNNTAYLNALLGSETHIPGKPNHLSSADNTAARPLAIDLFCGMFGWSDGLIAEGWQTVGFDLEDMRGQFGFPRLPHTQLIIQDVLTLHGSQFRNANLIVASPPCQEYSYMAMPWKLAKAKAAAIRADTTGQALADLNRLFEACFRIQAQASLAAGRHIPLIVENVRGAIPWVGRSRWNFGSFHLWGDVPALMPITFNGHKSTGMNWSDPTRRGQDFTRIAGNQAIKNGSWFNVAHNTSSGHGKNPVHDLSGLKHKDQDGYERTHPNAFGWKAPRTTSKGKARKYASAMIAKIPLPLSRHIGATFRSGQSC
jgi:hypothetical protein